MCIKGGSKEMEKIRHFPLIIVCVCGCVWWGWGGGACLPLIIFHKNTDIFGSKRKRSFSFCKRVTGVGQWVNKFSCLLFYYYYSPYLHNR